MFRAMMRGYQSALKPAASAVVRPRTMTTKSGQTFTLRSVDSRITYTGSLSEIHDYLKHMSEQEKMKYELSGLGRDARPYPFGFGAELSREQILKQKKLLERLKVFPLTVKDGLMIDITGDHDAHNATSEQFN